MRKLTAFNSQSLDGFFTDENGDISWAHRANNDAEWNAFVTGNAKGNGTLLFGRVTYDLMNSYWPTPMAEKNDPALAKQMNQYDKIVFSRKMKKALWNNTTLLKGDLVDEVRKMKRQAGEPITILGSGSIISQLTEEGLIDEYSLVIVPVILGKGKTMFEGVAQKRGLKLTGSRTFGNGNVLLSYKPETPPVE